MIENVWIIIPNIIASYMVMVNKEFYANMIYCFGYLLSSGTTIIPVTAHK